jgi:Cdc6-like AAA superfamily ATPase
MSKLHPGPGLRGRRSEYAELDRLLAGVRAGRSQLLVVRGEAGVGKTALLEYLVEQASDCRVARRPELGAWHPGPVERAAG